MFLLDNIKLLQPPYLFLLISVVEGWISKRQENGSANICGSNVRRIILIILLLVFPHKGI